MLVELGLPEKNKGVEKRRGRARCKGPLPPAF